jgi:DNA modification methylase
MAIFHKTKRGEIVLGDSLEFAAGVKAGSVDLTVTSPPFGLVRKKDYGNVESHEYVDWFKPFGREFKRILKPSGSLVIDMGGADSGPAAALEAQ